MEFLDRYPSLPGQIEMAAFGFIAGGIGAVIGWLLKHCG